MKLPDLGERLPGYPRRADSLLPGRFLLRGSARRRGRRRHVAGNPERLKHRRVGPLRHRAAEHETVETVPLRDGVQEAGGSSPGGLPSNDAGFGLRTKARVLVCS